MDFQATKANKNDVFLGGIPIDCSTGKFKVLFLDEMTQYLEKYGKIESCRLTVNKNGTLKGFGFARYQNSFDAQKACGSNHSLRGKRVRK